MRFFATAAVIGGITLTSTSALADEASTRTTTAGKVVELNRHAGWHTDCSQGAIPHIDITKQPTNGTVNIAITNIKITRTNHGDLSCLGKTVQGVIVYYKPDKSFKGIDNVEYNDVFNNLMYKYIYTITVR